MKGPRPSAPRTPEAPNLSGFSPVLLSSLIVDAFANLGIGVSIWAGEVWRAIHLAQNPVMDSELEHGVNALRSVHNVRCRDRGRQTRAVAWAEHFGFHDLFLPLSDPQTLHATLLPAP